MSLTQAAFCLAEENQPDRDSIYQEQLNAVVKEQGTIRQIPDTGKSGL